MYYVCSSCKSRFNSVDKPVWLCRCGKPLSVRYNWEKNQSHFKVNIDEKSLWRYESVLPKSKTRISLGEGFTPLVPISETVYVKNETLNPTGSFKDRGMSLAITMAKEQNVESICLPSAGNAGISAAAYCKEAKIDCHVFLPETIPNEYLKETKRFTNQVTLKGKTISDAAKEMISKKENSWFDISTLKEPFRVEGKKTLGYEIAEQLGWRFPKVVVYETGGGTGLIGMWKAFKELKSMGIVKESLPRMVAAQSSGCAPVVRGFQNLSSSTDFWKDSNTIALGLNVPGPIGGHWILDILYQSNGLALDIPEKKLLSLTRDFNQITSMNSGAEGGVVWGAYRILKDIGWILPEESVVLFATGIERCKL